MNAVIPLLLGLALMALGYFIHSKFIAEKIFQLKAGHHAGDFRLRVALARPLK